jgi:hypothetical protein
MMTDQLRAFDQMVRTEIPALLKHYQATTDSGHLAYVDQPGRPFRVRPWCDALEIGLAFGLVPAPFTEAEWITKLREFQDPTSGLCPEHIPEYKSQNPRPPERPEWEERYSTMIVQYALEGLRSSLARPVANAENIGPDLLLETLHSLDWAQGAWGAGAWVDCYATCLYLNKKYFESGHQIERLFEWLNTHVDAGSGLWGQWRKQDRWLQPINGFYRLTRGTYAQFGRRLPHPEQAIDTILLHAQDAEFFAEGRGTACNVLDVVHPLWLCLQQTSHRREDARAWILERLPLAIARWHPGRGLAFDPCARDASSEPGLQGTEMWLSIIYLMATVTGLAENLSYSPVGVHRLAPALT